MGGSHFRERGFIGGGVTKRGVHRRVHEKGGSQGGSRKGGSQGGSRKGGFT